MKKRIDDIFNFLKSSEMKDENTIILKVDPMSVAVALNLLNKNILIDDEDFDLPEEEDFDQNEEDDYIK